MLARANRLLRGADFRKIMRLGRKQVAENLVGYQTIDEDLEIRFGFVISKACGNAVQRNKLKRRLRALARESLPQLKPGSQLVVRALPGSCELDFETVDRQFHKVIGLVEVK
jgi:ribonuclease P protein component